MSDAERERRPEILQRLLSLFGRILSPAASCGPVSGGVFRPLRTAPVPGTLSAFPAALLRIPSLSALVRSPEISFAGLPSGSVRARFRAPRSEHPAAVLRHVLP